MKSYNNIRSVASTQHKIPFSCRIQQEFLMQEQLQQYQIQQNQLVQYCNLLNQVLFVNEGKKMKRDGLKKNMKESIKFCNSQRSQISQSASRVNVRIILEKEDLQICQKKINQQQQIKNHLLKDINQITKSINLLKSDIGRIILKTQSTTILQKKTNKTQVLMNDQLKKVNLALQKDYAQINQTNNLQIKFNNKLKNICNNESLSLFRMKQHLSKIKQRQEYIYDRINERSNIMKSLNQREKLKQIIKIIGEKNRLRLSQLLNMIGFVNDISKEEYKSLEIQYNEPFSSQIQKIDLTSRQINQPQISQNIDKYLYLRIPSFKSKIKQIQTYLVKFISLINSSLLKNNCIYEENLNKSLQYSQKLKELNEQFQLKENEIYNNQRGMRIDVQEYNLKYRDFKQKIKVIMGLWCFIENNSQITQQENYQKHDQINQKAKNTNNKKIKRQSSVMQSSFTYNESHYLQQLYNLTLYLGNLLQDYELQQQYLLKKVQFFITKWLKNLKQKIQTQKKSFKDNGFKTVQSFKSTVQLIQQQTTKRLSNPIKYRLSGCSSSDIGSDKFKLILSLFNKKSNFIGRQLQDKQAEKKEIGKQVIKTEGNQGSGPPQRIKYIKKIDKQHHLLLKNVLKCQKQNNLKDYKFKKQFTRTKWAQKNIVQQQKRYQANFTFQAKNVKHYHNLHYNKGHNSQRFGHNRLKTVNAEEITRRRQSNDIFEANTKISRRQGKHYMTDADAFLRYSLMNEDQSNMMFLNSPKPIFNSQKLNRKSTMIERTQQIDDLTQFKINSKISFADGDPQQFY